MPANFSDVLQRRWLIVLSGCLLAGLIAALYWSLAARVFESSVELLVMQKDPALTSVSEPRPSDGRSEMVDEVLATHIRIFGSRKVIADAIEKESLDQLPGIQQQIDKKIRADGYSAEDYIVDQLHAGRGGKGEASDAQVLHAEFRHTDKEEAQQILQAVVDSYQQFLAKTFSNVGSQAFGLFEQSRDDLSLELRKAETAYAEFRQTAPVIFPKEGGLGLYEGQLVELAEQKNLLQQERAAIKSRLELVRQSFEGPQADQLTDSQRLALVDESHVERLTLLVNVERGNAISEAFQANQPIRTEKANVEFDLLVSLQLEADEIEAKFGAQHPRLASLSESIAGLRDVVQQDTTGGSFNDRDIRPADVVRTYRTLLENDLVHLDQQIASLDRSVEKVETQAKQASKFEVKNRIMLAELERQQELYSSVVARLPELGMTSQFGGYITEVIAPVSVADLVWPTLLQLGSLALALGLCAGLGGAFYAETTDRSFQSPEQVGEALGLPVLGVLSKIKSEGTPAAGMLDHRLVSAVAPESLEAQTIRRVRTSLLFATQESEGGRAIQFTSPTPGDGSSLIAVNVAIALASAGNRVVLLDADLRRPMLNTLLGQQPKTGLSELLADTTNLPDVLYSTNIENLDLLPAGDCPANPTEQISMPRFVQLLSTLRDKYDFVIVDTPPLLAVSDPLSVAQHADGVVLVVPIKPQSMPAAEQAAHLLQKFATKVIGAVANDLDDRWTKKNQPLAYQYLQDSSTKGILAGKQDELVAAD